MTRTTPFLLRAPKFRSGSEWPVGYVCINVTQQKKFQFSDTPFQLGREVLDLAAAAIRPGITTDEIDRIVHEATIARDCYPSPLNYNGFPKVLIVGGR